MAKRFFATELWEEDWFLEMPKEYQMLWFFVLSKCDHAGIFRVNLKVFSNLSGSPISAPQALAYFNAGKARIREISASIWLIEDFFSFQYGENLNPNNRVHKSILEIYKKHNINILSIRGLNEVKLGSNRGQIEVKHGVKDKDKDKDKEIKRGGVGERVQPEILPGSEKVDPALRGVVVYDAETEILKSQKEFERICMTTNSPPDDARRVLHKYHLFLTEREQYPKGRKAVFAGFEKFLLNEKNFKKNGSYHKQNHTVGKTIEFDEPQ